MVPPEVFEVSCYAGKPSAAWRVAAGDILIDASSSRPFSTFLAIQVAEFREISKLSFLALIATFVKHHIYDD